jgi:hypothetical protein
MHKTNVSWGELYPWVSLDHECTRNLCIVFQWMEEHFLLETVQYPWCWALNIPAANISKHHHTTLSLCKWEKTTTLAWLRRVGTSSHLHYMGVWGSRGHPKPREKRRRIRSITLCSEVHTYMRQRQWKEKNNSDPQKQHHQHCKQAEPTWLAYLLQSLSAY